MNPASSVEVRPVTLAATTAGRISMERAPLGQSSPAAWHDSPLGVLGRSQLPRLYNIRLASVATIVAGKPRFEKVCDSVRKMPM